METDIFLFKSNFFTYNNYNTNNIEVNKYQKDITYLGKYC